MALPSVTNLISWWKLEEASGTRIDAHGSNNLADNNTVTNNTGKQGNAAQFTLANSEFLDIADNASLSMGDIDFTIGAWVYLDSLASMDFVSKFTVAGNDREYTIRYNHGTTRFEFVVSSDGTAVATASADILGAPGTATWYFIIGYHDASANTINIQVNNGGVDSTAHAGGVADGGSPFNIGARASASRFTNGRIDEAFVFKKVLAIAEQTSMYNSGNGVTYENLVGFSPADLLSSDEVAHSLSPIASVQSQASVSPALVHELFTRQFPDQKYIVATPGLAEYKVRIKDQTGSIVSEFDSDSWISLTFNHNESDSSACRFEILNQDSRATLLGTDYQLEVWRRNKILGIDWYIEWEGFVRTLNLVLYQNDIETTVVYSVGYIDLLRRAYIMYKSGSDFVSKSGVGESVMKEYVEQNMGASALASVGRETDNVVSNFQIEADRANGTVWSGSRTYKGLLPTCQAIAGKTGLSFDVVGIDDELLFEFRVYDNQRGLDRTLDNVDGNIEALFTIAMGNMSNVTLSLNRSNEVTAAFALGPGREEARQLALVESTDQFDSPWNRAERAYNASNQKISELSTFAGEKLREFGRTTSISFMAVQTVNSYYRKDYWWGDKITAIFKQLRYDLRIIEVRITVSDKSGIGESISLNFMDDKR